MKLLIGNNIEILFFRNSIIYCTTKRNFLLKTLQNKKRLVEKLKSFSESLIAVEIQKLEKCFFFFCFKTF